MKFSHENLEIWQLGMKLVSLIYSLKERFLVEDKFGLWDQLVRTGEAIPRDIAEGYAKTSKRERALYIERAKSETAEVDTSFKEAVKKGRITKQEYKHLIEPLIKELYFKIIGYRKWLLGKPPKRSDPPSPPSVAINNYSPCSPSEAIHHLPHGFTLVELLVAIGILGTVGGIATMILFTTLQSASKSDIMREVKQNGDYAISVMERMIRNATAVSLCSGPSTSLTITSPDAKPTTFILSGTQIASNSANSGMLTNTKVAASNLSFTCTRVSGKPDVVSISFTLSQAGTPARVEEKASINFKTTVSLRTY